MAPPPPGTESTQPGWASLMPLVFMFMLMYFLLIRPQQKRAKEHQKLVEGLETGDQVVTSGGIVGVVTNRKEKTVMVKTGDNVKIEVLKTAVQSVTKPDGKTASVA